MRVFPIAGAFLIGLVGIIGGSAGSASAATDARVSVVHGIPNTPVDVFVNGQKTLNDFKPGTVAGPLSLAAGSYAVKVYPAGKDTGTPVITATAAVKAGANISLVAHLSAAGKPTLTPYVNDTAGLKAGMTRLVVRHDAAAPAVDVRAGGKPVISSLTNPNSKQLDIPAGTVKADVVLAGTDTVVIGPATLGLDAGNETIVYAVGSAADKTLQFVTQTISGIGMSPNGMPAGTGGLQHDPAVPVWLWAVTAAGGMLVLSSAAMLVVRRRAATDRRAFQQ